MIVMRHFFLFTPIDARLHSPSIQRRRSKVQIGESDGAIPQCSEDCEPTSAYTQKVGVRESVHKFGWCNDEEARVPADVQRYAHVKTAVRRGVSRRPHPPRRPINGFGAATHDDTQHAWRLLVLQCTGVIARWHLGIDGSNLSAFERKKIRDRW